MDLFNLIMDSMTSPGSTATLSQKTGVSKEQTASLIASALPVLLQSMQNNASTETGAMSLLNALTQHTNTQSVPQQIAHADTVDGAKILAHILGQNQTATVNQLSKKNGLSTKQTMALLSLIAPALLSALSAATSQQGKKQGFDLSDGFDMNDVFALVSAASGKKQNSGLNVGTMLSVLGMLMK